MILRRISWTGQAHVKVGKHVPGIPISHSRNLPLSLHLLQTESNRGNPIGPHPRISTESTQQFVSTFYAANAEMRITANPPKLSSNEKLSVGHVSDNPRQVVLRLLLKRLVVALPADMDKHTLYGHIKRDWVMKPIGTEKGLGNGPIDHGGAPCNPLRGQSGKSRKVHFLL